MPDEAEKPADTDAPAEAKKDAKKKSRSSCSRARSATSPT